MSLAALLQQSGIWRGRDHAFHHSHARNPEAAVATGHALLDAQLPDGGWPRGALTEILHVQPGIGELQILMPSLSRLTHERRYVAMIDPPWTPYAPGLAAAGLHLPYFVSIGPLRDADRLWTLEQALRAGHCAAVLAWPAQNPGMKALRRLQLAAEAGKACGFLFRPATLREQPSPAVLRLQLLPDDDGLRLDIFKCRGRHFATPLRLSEAIPMALHQNGAARNDRIGAVAGFD